MNQKVAIFALGCFWSVQSFFDEVDGVLETEVGYTWGEEPDPTYNDLFDHTEAIKITYNPDDVSYDDLLEYFLEKRDPTLTYYKEQYKSAIYYQNQEEKQKAEDLLASIQTVNEREVTIQVLPATEFYRAEEYHQKYNDKLKGIV